MKRRLLIGACIALLVPSMPLAAEPAESTTPRLAATNVITGTGISSMAVHLDRPATLYSAVGKSPDVKIRGAGRFVGIALVHEGRTVVRDGAEVREIPALLIGRYRQCLSPGCDKGKPVGVVLPLAHDWQWNEDLVLPRGDYTLYLIADGAPAQVELRLHGASGEAALSPTTAVDAKLTNLESSPFPTKNVFTAVDSLQYRSKFLSFHAMWVHGFGPFAGHLESCLYRGRRIAPAGAEHVEGSPYCTHAAAADRFSISGSFSAAIVTASDYRLDFYGAAQPLPRGRWTHSLFYRLASVIEDAGSLVFQLPYPRGQ